MWCKFGHVSPGILGGRTSRTFSEWEITAFPCVCEFTLSLKAILKPYTLSLKATLYPKPESYHNVTAFPCHPQQVRRESSQLT